MYSLHRLCAAVTLETPAAVVKCVEASTERVYACGSDGRVRVLGLEPPAGHNQVRPTLRARQADGQLAELQLLQEIAVSTSRKAIDRIALLTRIGKAAVLSEGILTFHSLPSLAALPVHPFTAIKGVVTFSLDEDEVTGGGEPHAVHICAIRRRTVQVLRVTDQGVTSVKEHPLRGGAYVAVLRRRHLCIADLENYSIIDLDESRLMPLLPISQSPNSEPLSKSTSSTSQSSALDPRQRPSVACIAPNEFLIASHTGNTTLGVFVTETGEPCRGTLEWSSNVRSMCIEPPYVIALLHNNTIEVHSYVTQELVQVIQMPAASPTTQFEPRSLTRAWPGFDMGGSAGSSKTELVPIALLPHRSTRPSRPSVRSDRNVAPTPRPSGAMAKTLVVGKNSLYALAPSTLISRAEALIERDRLPEALAIAGQVEEAGSTARTNLELRYVFLRAAFLALHSVLFQDAFELFLRSHCDPRLVVRLFASLCEGVILEDDEIMIPRGLQFELGQGLTVDDYILASLKRNYSPYIKPDVETAATTSELRVILGRTAHDCLLSYLVKWRVARRWGAHQQDLREIDIVVDTTLARLLAESGRTDELLKLLNGTHDCALLAIEPALFEAGLYTVMASLFLAQKNVVKTLEIWTRLCEGVYVEEGFTDGLRRVFDLLWTSRDQELVIEYGLWLIVRDRAMGLKLFSDPTQVLSFHTKDLFARIVEVDSSAADLFLENVVLSKRDTDSGLHADLIRRYINRLGQLLANPETKQHLREQESSYSLALSDSTTSPPSFLAFLTSQFSLDSPRVDFDRVRLKTILFLATSTNYDVPEVKKELEDLEMKGLRGLTLERAILYGKLQLDRQALSLLLHSLHDLTSAETYCHQSGDPLLLSDLAVTASRLDLPMPAPTSKINLRREGEEARKAGLSRLLVDMVLAKRIGETQEQGLTSNIKAGQVARILETQATHLNCLEVLPLLPREWPLSLFSSFLARSARRSQHARNEALLFKSLALCQNLQVSERLGDTQRRLGGTLQERGGESGGTLEAEVVLLPEKEPKGFVVTRINGH